MRWFTAAVLIVTAGLVNDKFKLNMNGETFTAITARWDTSRHWITVLENYSLANPAKPQRVGSLELAAGEQLQGGEQGHDLFLGDFQGPADAMPWNAGQRAGVGHQA